MRHLPAHPGLRMSRTRKGRTLAASADRHDLYQKSVQAPDWEVEFLVDRYRELRGKTPLVLREDFCGTALVCVEWCKSSRARRAIGVDLCADTLEWGQQHNMRPAGREIARRIQLINANVLDVSEPKADITCAMNFSYCVFKTRGALRHYFETVHAGLKEGGLFALDLLGGTETMGEVEEEREIPDSDVIYIWDQASFNPINHHMICYIHFRFPDGSKMQRAYSYDWRLWTLPELQELLTEAGFRAVHVFWEKFSDREDENGYLEGTGEYEAVTEVDNQESWVAYIIAEA